MLILMCGLSFSGKSTLAGQLGREFSAMVFSLDSINEERGLYGGQGIPVEGWVETNRLAEERCNAQLQAGRNVIIDDTGSPRFIRNRWHDVADEVLLDHVASFESPTDEGATGVLVHTGQPRRGARLAHRR
jgi:predicted kinase